METTNTHCNHCCGVRVHDVLHREIVENVEEMEPDYFLVERDEYTLVKCRGCQSVALLHRFSPSFGPDELHRYPPAEDRQRSRRVLSFPLEADISDLLKEIYVAVSNNLYRLAVMGIRSLLERIMIHKNKDQGTFEKNLQSLLDMNFISQRDFDPLKGALDVGHAATHRGYAPSEEEVLLLLDTAEHTMECIYANPERAEKIGQHSLPPRQRAAKSGKKEPNLNDKI